MCGILGYAGAFPDDPVGVLRAMIMALRHRGPDDSGEWFDSTVPLALGHARLSILDLSEQGHQPMISSSGRFVIVFNGEVYNANEIIAELNGLGLLSVRGHSDTEVMLLAIEAWGVRRAVDRFRGMFAFVIWDRERHQLTLVRDRLGVKPLYYGWMNGIFFFASELKGICAHPSFQEEINRDAVALLMRFGYIPTPYSIYSGIFKLPCASILTLSLDDLKNPPSSFSPFAGDSGRSPITYWSLREVAEHGLSAPFLGSEIEATNHLDRLLTESVALRMVADVPLGAFLSGGIDSSLVVALMQSQSSMPIRTFTIGFEEGDYNEAQHAKLVAAHLGTNHTELFASAQDALDVVPLLPAMYDEPIADSSQIPTYLVSKLARSQVTVGLSGDGGDELFAGYSWYPLAQKLWRYLSPLPRGLKSLAEFELRRVRVEHWDTILGSLSNLPWCGHRFHNPGDKIHKLARVLTSSSRDELYARLLSYWDNPHELVLGSNSARLALAESNSWPAGISYLGKMMFQDTSTYLPDDIMVKVDRASMAVGLEAREPLLDHRLLEFAWTLPDKWKLNRKGSKWLLRQVLYKYVPSDLVERPKMGFCVPIDSWLRGPLRDWAESLITPTRVRDEGYLNSDLVNVMWAEHLQGRRRWQGHLWAVLMFQAWLRQRNG